MKIRTRYAPSPTGKMHVGNLRSALYEFLIAKHDGGSFMLRIEDTDQERFVEGATEIIYRTMEKTGLIHDEGPDKDGGYGPYVQSERMQTGIYMKYAKELIDKGEAYYCFCTKERLDSLRASDKTEAGKEIAKYDKHCLHLSKEEIEAKLAAGEPFVIRQNMPTTGTTSFTDAVYGTITVENEELDDMILIKSDGFPTYNFANVVDDHLMNITHVIRGTIGATVLYTTHIGVGAGALAGAVTLTIRDLSLHTITTTTIHLTTAVAQDHIAQVLLFVRIVHALVADHLI